MAAVPGFEPRQTVSEAVVLPLHYTASANYIIHAAVFVVKPFNEKKSTFAELLFQPLFF